MARGGPTRDSIAPGRRAVSTTREGFRTRPAGTRSSGPGSTLHAREHRFGGRVRQRLVHQLSLGRVDISHVSDRRLNHHTGRALTGVISRVHSGLPPAVSPRGLYRRVCGRTLHLNPLRRFLTSSSVDRVVVGNPAGIFIRHGKGLALASRAFVSSTSILTIVRHVIDPVKHHVSRDRPCISTHLTSNSHMGTVVPPLSLINPYVAVQGFTGIPLAIRSFIQFKA